MPIPPRRSLSGPQSRPSTRYGSFPGADPAPAPVPVPVTGIGDPTPAAGNAVNPFSSAVLPKEQYPLHFDLLMRDLYHRGLTPEEFQIIAADEVRLDEDGMDVEFTMLRRDTDLVLRRRVDVRHGRLVSVREC